jgi:hypothetical protein
MSAAQWNERVHVAALALCAVFLPWSTAFLSMAQLLLVLNWIIGGVLTNTVGTRWRAAFTRPPVLVFLGFLGLHVVGLLWTTDMGWGLDLVRILLPVLSFGVVLGGSERLSQRSFRAILLLGAWSAVACALFGTLFSNARADDYRGLSMFISHIRLVLLLCMAIVVFVWKGLDGPWWDRAGRIVAVCWSLYFINRLGGIQGFVILALVLAVVIWRNAGKQVPWRCWSLRMSLVLGPVAAVLVLSSMIARRTTYPDPVILITEWRSAGGERYEHDLERSQQENGHHVWTHIAWRELRRSWAVRSSYPIEGEDDRGHQLSSTLLRYMSSKGLTKDSVGVAALSAADVRAIEQGVPNHLEGERSRLHERFEQLVFEWQEYREKGSPNGHSMTMRLEFWRTGWVIAKEHLLFGVGTGDTQLAFDEAYVRTGSTLASEWRHRAHNQYLTLCISFGVFGLLFALFTWWWPARVLGAWRDPVFVAWAVIFGLSCLTDDTVETQAGATFFALYYALLVFGAPRPVSADEVPRSAPSPARV